jgi:signal transduction histidine kinase
VEFYVADEGEGIPPEKLERIFERFFRVDEGRTRERGGTGLGLSIVKHLVQLHGGEVWAESVPGSGTRIYFTKIPSSSSQASSGK